MRVDQNNVDVDIEMASLAKNQIYFNAMAKQLGDHISKINNVLKAEP